MPNSSAVEGDVPHGHSSKASSEKPHPVSLLHSSNITLPVSVQKQPQAGGPSGEGFDGNGLANTNFPPRRKRKPWSEEEDLELIAAVKIFGEGNWANIVKGEFKGDRTASQLSQVSLTSSCFSRFFLLGVLFVLGPVLLVPGEKNV